MSAHTDFVGFDEAQVDDTETPQPTAPAPVQSSDPAMAMMSQMMTQMAQMQMQMMAMMQTQTEALQALAQAPQAPAQVAPTETAPTTPTEAPAQAPEASEAPDAAEDPHVKKSKKLPVKAVEATITHLDDRGVTLRLPDGRGCYVARKAWKNYATNAVSQEWGALEVGETRTWLLSDQIAIEKPVYMKASIQRIEDSYVRVRWKGSYGSISRRGILNQGTLPLLAEGSTEVLEVLPYFVRTARGSKSQPAIPAWVEAVTEGR